MQTIENKLGEDLEKRSALLKSTAAITSSQFDEEPSAEKIVQNFKKSV